MSLVFEEGRKLKENGIFIVGVPSRGNVGQLAMDILLATLWTRIERIGCISSDNLLPMVGCMLLLPNFTVFSCLVKA